VLLSLRLGLAISALAITLVASGCSTGPAYSEGPPDGWVGEGDRWWKDGIDTAHAFRDLESIESMGKRGAGAATVGGRGVIVEGVQRGLVRLYRNEPEVIDSLFRRVVVPRIENAELTPDTRADIERLTQESYRALSNNFQEPRAAKRLGEDIRVTYPDSLRKAGIGGAVRMQVHVDADGEPVAIALIESVHPVLDQIAMQATTEMRWRPAYLMRRGRWFEVPSWARFNVTFSTGTTN
jgi:TonB family protein